MKNKILSFALAICFTITCSITAFAGGPDTKGGNTLVGGVIPEDPISTAEQLQQIKAEPTYTAEQKNILISDLLSHKNKMYKLSTNTESFVLPNFPYSYQEGNYWCVPAVVQMTLKYINGKSPSQTSLAESMGVDNSSGVPLSEAVPFLNNSQNNANYTQIWPNSVSEMKNDFYAIMKNEDAPAIISTIFTKEEGFPYDMNYHHALCVTGQKANGESFRLHDPIHNSNIPESYYITAENIMVGINSYIA